MTTCDDGTPARVAGQVNSPFVQIPTAILYSGLSAEEFQLYAVLLDKSWKTGNTPVTNVELGTVLDKCRATVIRILNKLEARGLVVRTEVPATDQCPAGRLLTVNGRVGRGRKNATGGVAKTLPPPVAETRPSSNTKRDTNTGRRSREGERPSEHEKTVAEQIAEWQHVADTAPLASMRRAAEKHVAQLSAQPSRLDDAV